MSTTALLVWSEFAVCVAAILRAGLQLTRDGETIADITGLSRGWIGMLLVATVTSLPELVTGLSAVAVADAPDLAVGNVLGSCVFNLMMLGLVAMLHRRQSLFAQAEPAHLLAAVSGLLMLGWTAATFWLSDRGLMPAWGSVSSGSVVLVLLYALALRWCHAAQRTQEPAAALLHPGGLRPVLLRYLLSALVIVAAGLWLPGVGLRLAELMGWSNSLVGTLLMAAATTAPEFATTLGALRLGAVDMALGNLLGSNLFDLLILSLDDLAYLKAPLFEGRSPVHLLTVLTALGMTAVVSLGLLLKPHRRVAGLGSWPAVLLLLIFVLHLLLQVRLGSSAA